MSDSAPIDSTPFHPGELAVQERAGETREAARNAAALSDRIPRGALRYLANQPFVVLATERPSDGAPEPMVLFGEPGFVTAPDEGQLALDLDGTEAVSGSPPRERLAPGARFGMLAIELSTRRRLRVNGQVVRRSGERLTLDVAEAFPNCPKYIQHRELQVAADDRPAPETRAGVELDDGLAERLARIDTLFVASRHETRGLDASHRGGPPGFLRPVGPTTLRMPDYPGNSMFQTLGNVETDGRLGVLGLDFTAGVGVLLETEARLRLDVEDDPLAPTGGSGRHVDLEVRAWREVALPAGLDWTAPDPSPWLPPRDAGPSTTDR